MARLLKEVGGRAFLVLVARHDGDVVKTPRFQESLTLTTTTDRYRLFYGGGVDQGYHLQLSQGMGLADPTKVIITCFGLDSDKVTSAIDELLEKTGIQEQNTSLVALEVYFQAAVRLFRAGLLPAWFYGR